MAHSNFLIFNFDPERIFEEIERFDHLDSQIEYITTLISTYKKIEPGWREVLHNHPQGLLWEKTEEYAELLGIAPDYDNVIEASYNIINVWPQWVLPKLNTYLAINRIKNASNNASVMRREIIQEEDLDSLALDVNYIKRELDQIQDLEARLDAYELFIEKAFENIRKGTLVLLDPNTGTQVHPQANHYKDECNRIISEHLSSIVDSLKLLIYLDYKRKGENPEISPTSVGPIKWLADDASLVRLLQLLLKHNYINSKYADLCGIASGHFIDAYNQPFTNERLRKHFDHPESIEDKTITTKIQWNHTEAMIIYLIVQLIDRRIIQHRMDQYAHIIEEHFRNKKGNDFKSAQTQKVKADIDQYYFEEEIISEKRRKAKSLMESIVEQIGKSEPGS